ncbi:hypothetical protein M404DRAFT_30730 [Pisolithus tinctorius Marx 270]|uniref:Uncharacterized protein n=1 Tax=Pisolithus tinctorius Marx 270 TaxID=870435 RepID=A0A0C3JNM7_PISTI|nr:hypothetical protein M404DRAFT_30730 [Pisolithus tinctorius Marx 270]
MSESRLIIATNNNNEGCAIVNWTQVPDNEIRYNTNDKEEVMKAKSKERKRCKVAEQAWQEEQAWLEAKRVAREQAEAERAEREKAERIAWEAEEQRVCKDEERRKAKEEREAERRCKAEAGKGDEAGASGSEASEVKKVVMDPSCMRCAWAQVVCKFLVDGNKKRVACVRCNQSKGKCWWPGDGKDSEASPKVASKVDKGKKQKADDGTPEPGLSQKKRAKSKLTKVLETDEPEVGGSRVRKAGAGGFPGLEDKLKWLIDVTGLIANNLVGLFEAHETVAKNSGRITNALEAMLNESYGFSMAVSPSDLGSSELNSNKLHEEAKWLKAHGKDEEEESKEEDESMAE